MNIYVIALEGWSDFDVGYFYEIFAGTNVPEVNKRVYSFLIKKMEDVEGMLDGYPDDIHGLSVYWNRQIGELHVIDQDVELDLNLDVLVDTGDGTDVYLYAGDAEEVFREKSADYYGLSNVADIFEEQKGYKPNPTTMPLDDLFYYWDLMIDNDYERGSLRWFTGIPVEDV